MVKDVKEKNNYPKFSVLMSLYIKEKPEYFDGCMKSIFANTVLPSEIVIVLDGPISEELRAVLDKYVQQAPELYKIVELGTNKGLGLALKEGINACTNEIIARMDTDDVCAEDRFERQIKFLVNNNLDVCSSHIKEFENDVQHIIARREVPIERDDIIRYQKKRSAFNHMAVMYKKDAVLKAGNYKDCPLMEDDLLWAEMILSGAKCGNVDEYLVYARTNASMIERRGGLNYYKKYKDGRQKIWKTGFINWYEYKKTCIVQLIVCLLPSRIRRLVFFKLLHKKEKNIENDKNG